MMKNIFTEILSQLSAGGNLDQLSIQGFQYRDAAASQQHLELSVFHSSSTKSSTTITTFKAHLKTELFAAAYDSV